MFLLFNTPQQYLIILCLRVNKANTFTLQPLWSFFVVARNTYKKRSCTNVSVVRVAIRLFPLPKGLFQFRFSKRFGVQTAFLCRLVREQNQFMFLFFIVFFSLAKKRNFKMTRFLCFAKKLI